MSPIRPKRDPEPVEPAPAPEQESRHESDPKAGAFELPAGEPTTAPPWGGRFGVPWANARPLLPAFLAAAAEFGLPAALPVAVGLVESSWRQFGGDGQPLCVGDAYGDGPSCGVMQVKPRLWAGLLPGADWRTAEGNVRLGCALLRRWIDETGSWQGAIRRYHPGTAANGTTPEGYVRCVAGLMAELGEGGDRPAPDPWRPYPFPAARRAIVTKPYDGAGFDRCQPRADRIRYLVTHITDGVPYQDGRAIDWYRAFFSSGGERARDALVDLVCARDGSLGILNDWRDPNNGGTRAGWANGGVDGIEGEGAAAYRAYPAVNIHGLSCENVSRDGMAWTDAMIETNVELRVWLAVALKVPAESYPIVPGAGYSMDVTHGDFSTKRCAGDPYRWGGLRGEIRQETKRRIAAWTGGKPAPQPEPIPTFTRFGFSLEDVRAFFNVIVRFNPDGTRDTLEFNEQGALSLFWLARAEREGVFPEGNRIWYADAAAIPGRETWASFANGWTAFLPAGDRAAWTWLDQWTPEEGDKP